MATMSTSPIHSPSDVRELVVEGLRRSLVGPRSATDISWPGEMVAMKNIDDPGFDAGPFPVGPWCDANGNEVVHRDPRLLYSVGLLFPLNAGPTNVNTDAEDDLEEDGEPDPLATPLPGSDDGVGRSEDDPDPILNYQKFVPPRSLGFTIRPDNPSQKLRLHFQGARYTPRTNPGMKQTWWVRRSFEYSVDLLASGESHSFSPPDSSLTLTLGTTQRAHGTSHLVTVWVRNDSHPTSSEPASVGIVFQSELSAEVDALLPLGKQNVIQSDSLDLLYSNEVLFATGHGCDVQVRDRPEQRSIVTTLTMPVLELKPLTPDIADLAGNSLAVGMKDLSDLNDTAIASVSRLIDTYEDWIEKRRAEISDVPDHLRNVAQQHIDACGQYLAEIQEGWNLVLGDSDVRKCLTLASRAMNQQRRAYNAPPRRLGTKRGDVYEIDGPNPHIVDAPQARWRPFQIAFVLAMLPRFTTRKSRAPEKTEDDWVNVIWMPTGGGKTEAYLGLAAFVILWERMSIQRKDSDAESSMKVFMRYTYRLLTVQQVSRAASLICALELIRRNDSATFGSRELRIGAWLGSGVTPNSRKAAIKQLKQLQSNGKKSSRKGFLLARCPWCGTEMNDEDDKPVGYKEVVVVKGSRVLAFCPDKACEFHIMEVPAAAGGALIQRGLPFLEVDEDLYQQPPDFVVGTIDKTARLPWVPEAQNLFGLNHRYDAGHPKKRRAQPPALFVQDELHLISGPLGSIDGVYEILLEELCQQDGGTSPIYIAATATTKNFESQAKSLYRRPARLIPPPGLSINDSFFARRDDAASGKVYVGICATGSMSGLDTQTAVLGSLAYHGATLGAERLGHRTDPWWSNVVFFSSRRALGLLSAAASTSLGQRIKSYRRLSGRRSGRKTADSPADGYADRILRKNRELTATSSDDINQVLDDLSIGLPSDQTIDLCMATSMIEVGLDVSRLGLMTVIGQPKSASQYIQSTGRVGRSSDAPGLVVTVFKTTVPRDLAHYEGFSHWHRRMYASVESASVTPFTRAALERSLPSFMATMLRMLSSGCNVAPSLKNWDASLDRLLRHIPAEFEAERANVLAIARDLHQSAASPAALQFEWDPYCGNGEPLIFGADSEIPPHRLDTPYWKVMNSMRNVDADSLVTLKAPSGTNVPTSKSDEMGNTDTTDDLGDF